MGKNIVFDVFSPQDPARAGVRLARHLVCHLAMTGYWDSDDDPWTFDYVEGDRKSSESDVRVRVAVETPDGRAHTLRFHDSRLFGRLNVRAGGVGRPSVGPELLRTSCQFSEQRLFSGADLRSSLIKKKSWEIKRALMEQSLVAGLGNIYAAESLYVAGIHPCASVSSLTDAQWEWLFVSCQDQLISAIARGLDYSCLAVYRRKTCRRDGTAVESVKVAGRTSYFCPTCQPPPE